MKVKTIVAYAEEHSKGADYIALTKALSERG